MLAPCPSCQRHVRLEDSTCPFCAASTAGLVAPTVQDGPRMSRAAMVAAAVGVAAIAGCQTLYGGPPRDERKPVTTAATEPAPVYGGPPPPFEADAAPAPKLAPSSSAGAAPSASAANPR